MSEFWEPVKEPIKAGQELLNGGEFGRPASRPASAQRSSFAPSRNLANTISDRRKALRRVEKHELAVSSDCLTYNSRHADIAPSLLLLEPRSKYKWYRGSKVSDKIILWPVLGR